MALTALGPIQAQAVGSYTVFAYGNAGANGTTTVTVTIPTMTTVLGVVYGGGTSTTAPWTSALSGNTFTATVASNDQFSYIAFGLPRL